MSVLPCISYQVLNVAFTAPTIPPVNGYVVKWRVVGETEWNVVSNQYNNPVQIAGVPTCYAIEGTIQADCGGGNLGNPINFALSAQASSCYTFTLLQSANYTYVSCGGTQVSTVTNSASQPTSICAIDGSVSGGSFTRSSSCIS
jgi:hypothetical protein